MAALTVNAAITIGSALRLNRLSAIESWADAVKMNNQGSMEFWAGRIAEINDAYVVFMQLERA